MSLQPARTCDSSSVCKLLDSARVDCALGLSGCQMQAEGATAPESICRFDDGVHLFSPQAAHHRVLAAQGPDATCEGVL